MHTTITGENKIITLGEEGFTLADGTKAHSIVIPQGKQDDQWQEKQDASIDEYEDHHNGGYPQDVLEIAKHFSGFCLRHLKGTVLDVGCGISTDMPHYFPQSDTLRYVGLDPIAANMDRNYSFMCAMIEDVPAACSTGQSNLLDGAVFATSLDHVRDINECAQALKAISKENAIVCFWTGLHDADIIAKLLGMDFGTKTLYPPNIILSGLKFLLYALITYPKNLLYVLKREHNLKHGKALDNLHFHYFTKKSIHDVLTKEFGDIIEELPVAGTNSVFHAVRLRKS